ncbi:MAG: excinuclease ABC subunit A [Planctomycetota bacterium]|jgi:excinuclease ABC subunit A
MRLSTWKPTKTPAPPVLEPFQRAPRVVPTAACECSARPIAQRHPTVPKIDSNEAICIRGASTHNLHDLDLDLPLGRWISVTGPSGSGKSSLVFDTIVRMGERRFLGSLSARARHFFGKLGRSEVSSIEGLPATIAIGQKASGSNPRSTVGTLTGTLDLLRLTFARLATGPEGESLTRSHFSFNHPVGQCSDCRGLGVEDRVDPSKIIADATKSIRDGALVPTLKNGYTVYSQVTLEVMDRICRAHGFDVDTPWQVLSKQQQDCILYGTRALKVPFGKHSIESRMKWEGITARPREEGYYLGLIPVIEETLKRNRNANILRFVSSASCSSCQGTRLARVGRSARIGSFSLPDLLAVPAMNLIETWSNLSQHALWKRVQPSLESRVNRLVKLGLGHLQLDRISTSLSGGEAQRVRLAAQLGADLSGVLFALDEPTLGLHPESQAGMRDVLDELVDRGNSLIVVEHDPDMVRHADFVVALGPGAGSEGGQIVATDIEGHERYEERRAHPLGSTVRPKENERITHGRLRLEGATLHNLQDCSLELGLGVFNVITGPSGAGKSSLVFGTLLPALLEQAGGSFRSLKFEGQHTAAAQAVDARPIGKTSRSTPATWCGLFDLIRKRFAKLDSAKVLGLTASHFSYNNASGRCPICEGLGFTRIGLHLFEDIEVTCTSCDGQRYNDEVLAVSLRGKTIAHALGMTFAEAVEFFESDKEPRALCAAMVKLGLGYLALGQSSSSLSRGESQRIKLGALLGSQRTKPTLVLLDEPDRGLAPTDIAALLEALDALVDAGHTLVAISHHRQVWAAADRLIEVREGQTNHAPRVDWSPQSVRRPVRPEADLSSRPIQLRGVTTHNLKSIDVDFPRGKLTAVCGVSGSGKSSLVFDTLGAEASARFAESLPFQVRRFMRRLPQPELFSAEGLTPTLQLQQKPPGASRRSTVATQSEIGPLLRLLFSRAGLRDGKPCGLSASHFSRERTAGACAQCSGRGSQQRCDPELLVTHPELPLVQSNKHGALEGTRPGRFFTESMSQHMATLATALATTSQSAEEQYETLCNTPWFELPVANRTLALEGTGSKKHSVRWQMRSQVEGEGEHQFESEWIGLCRLIEREAISRSRSKKAQEWYVPFSGIPCEACAGTGLVEEARATVIGETTLANLETQPLDTVMALLQRATTSSPSELSKAALHALLPELRERFDELTALGLGHLSLLRSINTLSGGELQRVRLASVLRSGLSGITLILDEPTAGLHERDVLGLLTRLHHFQSEGNTIVVVSHRPSMLMAADHLIQVGPGAGNAGGELIHNLEIIAPLQFTKPRTIDERVRIGGARANNLEHIDVDLPASGYVCITGVSGSGKSSLLFDVIAASVSAGQSIASTAFEIPGGFDRFVAVHNSKDQTTSSIPLNALNIANEVAALFESPLLPKRAFKPGDSKGRCPACRGQGHEHVALDFLADLDLPCEVCNGRRFRPEVLKVLWRNHSIADVLETPAAQLLAELRSTEAQNSSEPKLKPTALAKLIRALETLEDLALAHIPLGRPRSKLSGGESARLSLATSLLAAESPALYLFDEPCTGLHEMDLQKLMSVFRKLGEQGNLIIATEHRLSAIAAADWVIELGPEGGPNGGRLIEAAQPTKLALGHTARALKNHATE